MCTVTTRAPSPNDLLSIKAPAVFRRCKVRAYESASHTFSLLNQDGSLPSRQYVQMACHVRPMLDASLPYVLACAGY
jgi:hypothetical protein